MKRILTKFLSLLAVLAVMAGTACALEAAESRVIYVYVTACESCARVNALLDGLPDEVELASGASKIKIERINLGEELARVQGLFEQCAVPEEDRIAPIVFVGDSYLAGEAVICENLERWLKEGRGAETAPEGENRAADLSDLTWLTAGAAGLVGGMNPCALSMLLLFLTTVMSVWEHPGRYAAAFLISKFAVYLLIGTVLMGAFRMWNPTWLPTAAKWLLTVLGGALILLNLSDALAARRERYGDIRNQLPTGIRGFLRRTIQRMMGGKYLMAAAIAVGAIVAMSEFLCAGQVYLATLLTAVQTDLGSLRWLLMLALYCAAFLLPSAMVTGLVLWGRSAIPVTDWLCGHMPAVKLLTAVMLAVLIAVAWLL